MNTTATSIPKKPKQERKQIGFVCASLPGHIDDAFNEGYDLTPNGHGFEIWQPEIAAE